MADGVCEDPPLAPLQAPPSPLSSHRSPSPLDLRRGDGGPPRLPFSISSLLSTSLTSQLSASRELLERASDRERELIERERELLGRERELLDRERDKIISRERERELVVRGDRDLLQDHSESEGEGEADVEGESHQDEEGVVGEDDDEVRGGDESNGEEEDPNRPFQPYSYTHMPFAAGLLPHLHGLLPSLGSLGTQGLNNTSLMSGPGGVIRVPAHRPPLSNSMVPPMSSSLPWLAGLTPLERTAAMAHHLSSLAPMTGMMVCHLIEDQ